jgi:hypothetical protein
VLDERGRLLVAEYRRADNTLRVVDASLAPSALMGPVDGSAEAAAEAHEEKAQQMVQLVGDYGKLVEDGELADGVFVVEGERFPMHRNVLAARSEYFRARFNSGMQNGGSKEVCYEDVSASAFPLLLWFLYAGELPAWEGGPGGGGSADGGRQDACAGSSSKVCFRDAGEPSAGAAAGGGPVPGGGAVRALSGGVWADADGGDGDTAAGVDARACSRGGAGGRDGVHGDQLPCDPGGLQK